VTTSNTHADDVTLTWDPNSEPDLVGYVLYWGTSSRSYRFSDDVGNTTTHTVLGLSVGQTYYFTVTAYDTAFNESGYSNEVVHTIPAPDADGDGISDYDETNTYGTDPNVADTDADGLNDGAELSLWGGNWNGDPDSDGLINLLDPDSDNDGLLDGNDPDPGNFNHKPETPLLNSPVNNNPDTALTPTLITNGFVDQDINDYHAQTRWQIFRTSDDLCVFDITTDILLTAIDVPILILEEGVSYYWKARFYDNHGAVSDWSPVFAFTTRILGNDANANGIPDDREVDANVDLDEDGIADNNQTNLIKSLKAKNGAGQLGVSIRNVGAVDSIQTTEILALEDIADTVERPAKLQLGLICFKLILKNPGSSVDIKVYFSEPAAEDANWFKYDAVNGWADFSSNITYSHNRKSVVVSLEDGGLGDADGTANGIIVDPAGLASLFGGGGDDDGSQEGCFIATAAYGSYMEEHVMLLRHFRDRILYSSKWGTAAVHFYYRHSPPLADFIAEHQNVRRVVRWGLLPVIGISWMTLQIGFWQTLAALMILFVLVIAFSGFMYKRVFDTCR
jgi:hypothetical protein